MRERRMSMLERRDAAEETSGGLTSDLKAVYGLQSLYNFGTRGNYVKPSTTGTSTPSTSRFPTYLGR